MNGVANYFERPYTFHSINLADVEKPEFRYNVLYNDESVLSLPADKYVARTFTYISLMFMCSVLNKSYSNT